MRISRAVVIPLASALTLAILAACAAPTTTAVTPLPTTAAAPTVGPAGATPTALPSQPAATPATPTPPAALLTATRPPTIPSATPRAEPSPRAADVGYIEGHAIVGPLTPVERVGVPTPTPSPETCTSRGLGIYEASGNSIVTSFRFRPDCTYRIALPPGTYVIRLDPQPRIGGSKDLPKTVGIESGKTTRLDIDIDTGIR